jgi:hypothetical protein
MLWAQQHFWYWSFQIDSTLAFRLVLEVTAHAI